MHINVQRARRRSDVCIFIRLPWGRLNAHCDHACDCARLPFGYYSAHHPFGSTSAYTGTRTSQPLAMLVWRVAGMTVGARMLGVVTAQRGGDGGGPGWVPARQGYRCGIEDKRLNPSEARTSELIAAFAIDGADKRSAETRFADLFRRRFRRICSASWSHPQRQPATNLLSLANIKGRMRLATEGMERWLAMIVLELESQSPIDAARQGPRGAANRPRPAERISRRNGARRLSCASLHSGSAVGRLDLGSRCLNRPSVKGYEHPKKCRSRSGYRPFYCACPTRGRYSGCVEGAGLVSAMVLPMSRRQAKLVVSRSGRAELSGYFSRTLHNRIFATGVPENAAPDDA
jgi:hypothetical protein